jgi:hypothetical protein
MNPSPCDAHRFGFVTFSENILSVIVSTVILRRCALLYNATMNKDSPVNTKSLPLLESVVVATVIVELGKWAAVHCCWDESIRTGTEQGEEPTSDGHVMGTLPSKSDDVKSPWPAVRWASCRSNRSALPQWRKFNVVSSQASSCSTLSPFGWAAASSQEQYTHLETRLICTLQMFTNFFFQRRDRKTFALTSTHFWKN